MDESDALLLDNQLCFPLYAASRELIKRYRPWLSALDLTYTQYIAMMVFWEKKKISVRELGRRLFLDSGTLTPVLKSLEAKGYIARYRCPEDERMVIVEITDAGTALRERAKEVPRRVGSCLHLSKDQIAELYTLLYALLGGLGEPAAN